MAFPIIQSYSKGGASDDVTSHGIDLPSGVNVGDLLLVFFTCDNNTEISVNTTASGNKWYNLQRYSNFENTASCYYKIAEASNTLILVTHYTESSTYIAYRISGAAISAPLIEYNEGTTANASPPSITPLFGNKEYLWIVYGGFEGTVIPSAAPSGFSSLITEQGSSSEQPSSASAYDETETSSSYYPGPFTSYQTYWVTFTVCIAPYGVDGVGLSKIGYYS